MSFEHCMGVVGSYLPAKGRLVSNNSAFSELSAYLRGELACALVLHVSLFNCVLSQCRKLLLLKPVKNVALCMTRNRTILGRG